MAHPNTHLYPTHVVQRFWSKVALCAHGETCAACCWPWLESTARGYGVFFVPKAYRTGRTKCERANRVCWRIVYGLIPEGLHVLHDCPGGDDPRCTNYHHYWLGTPDDNQKDSMRKGRRPTGEKHGCACILKRAAVGKRILAPS